MWTTFKVFTERVTVLLLFYVWIIWPQGMWVIISLTGIEPVLPALEVEVLSAGLRGSPSNWFLTHNNSHGTEFKRHKRKQL